MTRNAPRSGAPGADNAAPTAQAIADQLWGRRNRSIELPPPGAPRVLTIHVALVGSEPEIWRRVEVRDTLTLDHVHTVLQVAMGWTDSHLHHFGGPGAGPSEPPWFVTAYDEEDGTAESSARLGQVLCAPGDGLSYVYDFGDDWVHHLTLESSRPATDAVPTVRCLDGAGSCPPKDVGGIGTWNALAAALRADPDPHALIDDLSMYAGWLPEGTDPDAFPIDAVNTELSRLGDSFRLPTPHPVVEELVSGTTPDVRTELRELLLAAHRRRDVSVSDEQWVALLRPWQTILDLAHPDGLRLARELAAGADVVVDNFAVGVMERLGLGEAALRAFALSIDVIRSTRYRCRQTRSLGHWSGLDRLVMRPDPGLVGPSHQCLNRRGVVRHQAASMRPRFPSRPWQ